MGWGEIDKIDQVMTNISQLNIKKSVKFQIIGYICLINLTK
jgi:hypothetical protein